MATVAIWAARDQVWAGQVPFDNPLFEVLRRKREAQPAAGRLAEMNTVLAVNSRATFILILVDLRVLELYCHASTIELLDQTLAHYPLALVKFCLCQQPLLDE